jgi:hypothetical protein
LAVGHQDHETKKHLVNCRFAGSVSCSESPAPASIGCDLPRMMMTIRYLAEMSFITYLTDNLGRSLTNYRIGVL